MVRLGRHFRSTASPGERDAVRHFYTEILECKNLSADGITEGIPSNLDLFVFSNGEIIGIEYLEENQQGLSLAEQRQACWLELVSDIPAELNSLCLANGATAITDYWDRGHFYFHAPGGQVFRIISTDEQ